MSVAVIKTDFDHLFNDLGSALEKFGYRPSKEQVVIKPCISSTVGTVSKGDRTDPRIIEAIIRLFPDHEYKVAEGCFLGMSSEDSMAKHGYVELARHFPQVELVDLEGVERREISWEYGELEVPEMVLDHEYINIPTMKTHWTATVSLGAKNQKGLIKHQDKKLFHKGDLQSMIKALGKVVQPDLTIIDGIVGCEGNWPEPLKRRKKKAEVVVCGKDMFETDWAACALMGFDPAAIPHVGEGPVDYVEEGMRDIHISFRSPTHQRYWKFMRGHSDTSTACSGCVVNLQRGLLKMILSPYAVLLPWFLSRMFWYGEIRASYWMMGVGSVQPESKNACVICIGDCTRDFASEHDYPFISGCPHTPHAMFKGLAMGPRVPPPP